AVVADRNLARLLGLGNLPDQVDMQETVLERRALHQDVVGELEHALERARRNTLIKGLALLLLGLRLLVTADRQRALLGLDVELGLGETGHRYRDTVVVLAGPLDVVGRITRGAVTGDLVEEGKQPVEADGRTIEGSKIKRTHRISSVLSDMGMVRPSGPDLVLSVCSPIGPAQFRYRWRSGRRKSP